MKYTIFTIACALFLAGCTGPTQDQIVNITDDAPVNTATTSTSITPETGSTPPTKGPSEAQKEPIARPVSVPAHLLLPVLFAQQAPFGNWDELHEEACEEASMVIADKYFAKEALDEHIMETQIQALIAWEKEHSYQVDLSAQEMVDVLQAYFNRQSRIVSEATVDRIKYELAQGSLVIVPAAGRELHNPNFKQPGPIYHVLVVVGYDQSGFIVHDVGTRKGKNYHYSFETLINAIHDWDHKRADGGMTDEEMAQGRKVFITVASQE